MFNRNGLWVLFILIFASLLMAADSDVIMRPDGLLMRSANSEILSRQAQRIRTTTLSKSAFASVGETYTVGYTYYDMQHNDSAGKMVALDNEGGVHIVWMVGQDTLSSQRHCFYNYISPDGTQEWTDGRKVDTAPRSGYATLAVGYDNSPLPSFHQGRCIGADCTFHASTHIDIGPLSGAGRGVFFGVEPPFAYTAEEEDQLAIWPKIAYNEANEKIHLVASPSKEETYQLRPIVYWNGEFDTDMFSFTYSDPLIFGNPPYDQLQHYQITGISADIDSWGDKVAIAYHGTSRESNCISEDTGDISYNYYATYFFRNIYVQESNDGGETFVTRRITNYEIPDTPEIFIDDPDSGAAFRPYQDVNVVYDNNGKLHLVWTEVTIVANNDPESSLGIYPEDSCACYMLNYGRIAYWNEDMAEPVAVNPWWGGYIRVASPAMQHPSVGFDDDNNIFVVWEQGIPYIEDTLVVYADTVANAVWEVLSGIGNKEVMIAYSSDSGNNWSDPINITDTQAPGCIAGNCASEIQPTIAKKVDDFVHISYLVDKCPGMWPHDEGPSTRNDFIYHRIPKAEVFTNIEDNHIKTLPISFQLNSARPNPFNASTELSFNTDTSDKFTLKIYNIEGKLVKTVIEDKPLNSGTHKYLWDGTSNNNKNVASGTYIYELKNSSGKSLSKTMALVK